MFPLGGDRGGCSVTAGGARGGIRGFEPIWGRVDGSGGGGAGPVDCGRRTWTAIGLGRSSTLESTGGVLAEVFWDGLKSRSLSGLGAGEMGRETG